MHILAYSFITPYAAGCINSTMAKRFRQASLFETSTLASKKHHEESNSVEENEELSLSSNLSMDISMAPDKPEFHNNDNQEDQPQETESECFSPCCIDKTKPYQPTCENAESQGMLTFSTASVYIICMLVYNSL